MIVIGSHALSIQLEKIGRKLGRVPTDLDVLIRPGTVLPNESGLLYEKGTADKVLCKAPDGRHVEFEIAHPGTSAALYMNWLEMTETLDQVKFYGMKMSVAPLCMLYSLKRAHRHSPRQFEKHVQDYNLLRELFDQDVMSDITKLRYQETVAREKLKTPSLNKSAADFFDDKVSNRTFIHDQIHEVMAFGDRPMFEKIKIDPDKVACSKEKFFSLSGEQRDQCVQEEAYVIALERCIIPMLFESGPMVSPIEAYKWAVMRICTTLCSGWFREYAVENYDNLMLRYNWTYTDKFLDAVESGRIKRIER